MKKPAPQQQTLFRFVSLRNPERIERTVKDIKFISQPETLQTGVFYDAIQNRPPEMSKKEALLDAASTFNGLESENEVRLLNADLYDFSVWLTKNRSTYTEEELDDKITGITPLEDIVNGKLHGVWNNLFYQVITQKSFYIKEALMQILSGDHTVRKYKKDNAEYNRMLINAKVTLPTYLFQESSKKDDEKEDPKKRVSALPDKRTKKQLAISKAQFSNAACFILKKELLQLEKKYREEYKKAYDTAYSDYETDIAPILEQYNEDLEIARKQFCSVDYNPNIPYNPDDPCQQPDYVPYPNLPKFEFSFRKEIDPEELEKELSYESYNTLLDILGYHFDMPNKFQRLLPTQTLSPYELIESNDDYGSVFQHIDDGIANNNQDIIDNTSPTEPQTSIGGVVTPVIDFPNLPLDRFSLCTIQSGLTFIYTLNIGVPESLNVINIHVTQHNPDSSSESFMIYAPNTIREGNTLQLSGFFSYTFPDGIIENGPSFDFVINFSDGSAKSIKDIHSMGLLQLCIRGAMENSDDDVVVVPIETPPFIPSGFGVKQIGVADYLRVEQTIHCYLEGEVSHIENIMAREYKEKSSRRLLRNEETITVSSETEREQLTDTTTADRFEMQSEINNVIQNSRDTSGFVNAGYNNTGFTINTGLSFSNNTSKENSIRQTVTEAREITERALDRIVSKVREERIRKITEEYEENNKHGFDNRKGNEHVVGVYRWVNKQYKNQIYNYGRRMMYEFTIPDPARLHLLGMKEELETGVITDLTPPVDPRTATPSSMHMKMATYADVTETRAAYWAGIFNAEIAPLLTGEIKISESFADNGGSSNFIPSNYHVGGCKFSVEIPENYMATSYEGQFGFTFVHSALENTHGTLIVGKENHTIEGVTRKTEPISGTLDNVQNNLGVSFQGGDVGGFSAAIIITCKPTEEYKTQWRQETFKAIMDAYYEALAEYNRKKEIEEAKAVEIKTTNPGFYRHIENIILRKNCISYLIDQNPHAQHTYGKNFGNGNTFGSYEVNVSENLDNYAAFAKFIEQAFEWEIMSYNFYPYYWGPRGSWKEKYQFNESDDPVFRAFMQAGLARVIVTVRPGFEKAVLLYMATGQIWNGGQVPVIGDDMYMDLIDETKPVKAAKYGKAWTTLVPTSLTIQQARSIGLEVEKALPCNCDDTDDFENPEEVPCSDAFKLNDNKIGSDDEPEEPNPEE